MDTKGGMPRGDLSVPKRLKFAGGWGRGAFLWGYGSRLAYEERREVWCVDARADGGKFRGFHWGGRYIFLRRHKGGMLRAMPRGAEVTRGDTKGKVLTSRTSAIWRGVLRER